MSRYRDKVTKLVHSCSSANYFSVSKESYLAKQVEDVTDSILKLSIVDFLIYKLIDK